MVVDDLATPGTWASAAMVLTYGVQYCGLSSRRVKHWWSGEKTCDDHLKIVSDYTASIPTRFDPINPVYVMSLLSLLKWSERPTLSWWMLMAWRQKGTMPSANTMVTHLRLQWGISGIIQLIYLATINSLRSSGAIWRHNNWWTLVQVMACCLTAPSHYLSQCWLVIIRFVLYSAASHFKWRVKITATSPRGQWVKQTMSERNQEVDNIMISLLLPGSFYHSDNSMYINGLVQDCCISNVYALETPPVLHLAGENRGLISGCPRITLLFLQPFGIAYLIECPKRNQAWDHWFYVQILIRFGLVIERFGLFVGGLLCTGGCGRRCLSLRCFCSGSYLSLRN